MGLLWSMSFLASQGSTSGLSPAAWRYNLLIKSPELTFFPVWSHFPTPRLGLPGTTAHIGHLPHFLTLRYTSVEANIRLFTVEESNTDIPRTVQISSYLIPTKILPGRNEWTVEWCAQATEPSGWSWNLHHLVTWRKPHAKTASLWNLGWRDYVKIKIESNQGLRNLEGLTHWFGWVRHPMGLIIMSRSK